MSNWEQEFDVVVLGSGAGGMTAALTSAIEGLSVGLFEKSQWFGGTTANSGGGIWIPASKQAGQTSTPDSTEAVKQFLQYELGDLYDANLIDAFLESGPVALDYLAQHSDVKFQLGPLPDYHTDSPGAVTHGRALFPTPFDGRQLGKHFKTLRSPWKRFLLLGGMMVGRRELPALTHPFSSFANFKLVVSMLVRYAMDRITFHRGTHLLIGNALAARLLYSLIQRHVHLQNCAKAVELIQDNDKVIGVVIETPEGLVRVRARIGVVLATGGFPHNVNLRQELASNFPHTLSSAFKESAGDGLSLARQVGSAVDQKMQNPAFWTPASTVMEKDGSQTVMPYGHLDRGKPGAIIVNANAQRFVNEADSYHDVIVAYFQQIDSNARKHTYLICDHFFIRQYGLGAARPWPFPLYPLIQSGYLHQALTLRALAEKLQLDVNQLASTVATHNQCAVTGEDLEFGKGNSAFNRYNGDAKCQPNPCLRAIEVAPFYAIRIHPASLGTAIGIKTNANAQALNEQGQPIDGLFVCGNDMASIMKGAYPGPGVTLGPAIAFGYRAAMQMKQQHQLMPNSRLDL